MFTQVVIAPFFIGPKAYEAFELFLGKGQCLVVSIRYYWVISLWAFILAVMETTIKNCSFDVVIKPREIIDLRMLIQPGKDDKEIILCTECCLHLLLSHYTVSVSLPGPFPVCVLSVAPGGISSLLAGNLGGPGSIEHCPR
jgi:hypothetical protein